MAERFTDLEAQIVATDKAAVEALIGPPQKKGYWTKPAPPDGADATAVADFEAATLDEIWIYVSGRVHFSMSGIALQVDDKTRLDLPPDQAPLIV